MFSLPIPTLFTRSLNFRPQRSWPLRSNPTERRWGGEPVAENKRPVGWRGAGVLIPLSAGRTGTTASSRPARPAASGRSQVANILLLLGREAFDPTLWRSGNLQSQSSQSGVVLVIGEAWLVGAEKVSGTPLTAGWDGPAAL